MIGWSYDAAGNLLSDGTSSYTYDALNRAVTTGSTTNVYNADGVLVQQGSSFYTQDLAAPLSQILSDGTSTYVYGQERLFAQQGSTRTWYATDALGSVRQTLSDSGAVLGSIAYDPWGQVQQGSIPTFGFTGELQQGSNVYLRARWYNSQRGVFSSRDPFAGVPEQPYSLMPYQYAYANPVLLTDPSGQNPLCLATLMTGIGAPVAVGCFLVAGLLAVTAYAALDSSNHAIQQCGYSACWGGLVPAGPFDTTGGSGSVASPPHVQPPYTPPPGIAPQPLRRGGNVWLGPGVEDPGFCTVESFPAAIDARVQLPPILLPNVQGPVVLMARPRYSGPSDGYENLNPRDFQRVKDYTLPEALALGQYKNKSPLPEIPGLAPEYYWAKYLFVIDKEGNLRVRRAGGDFHHADLVDQGEHVYGAGNMFIDQAGKIRTIDDESGHFQPDGREFFPYLQSILRQQGIDISETRFSDFHSRP